MLYKNVTRHYVEYPCFPLCLSLADIYLVCFSIEIFFPFGLFFASSRPLKYLVRQQVLYRVFHLFCRYSSVRACFTVQCDTVKYDDGEVFLLKKHFFLYFRGRNVLVERHSDSADYAIGLFSIYQIEVLFIAVYIHYDHQYLARIPDIMVRRSKNFSMIYVYVWTLPRHPSTYSRILYEFKFKPAKAEE